jgi:hypothetical protein
MVSGVEAAAEAGIANLLGPLFQASEGQAALSVRKRHQAVTDASRLKHTLSMYVLCGMLAAR